MRAVGYFQSLPITDEASLQDLDLATPTPGCHDLLVKVKAVSVNPIDIKVRLSEQEKLDTPRILGFDASGTVISVGDQVKDFAIGDEVFYAGTINRAGSNSDYQVVDHRLVALKPKSVDFATAASLPLTSLTAYEMLFDRLAINKQVHRGKNVLFINAGAGGVGSAAIQLAKKLADIVVVASASRPQSQQWCFKMGADHVVDHTKPFRQQLEKLAISNVAFIFSNAESDSYLQQYSEIISPQGRIGIIDSPKTFDINPLKQKSVSVHWESMFTRSVFQTDDVERQGEILRIVAQMIDSGQMQPTVTCRLKPLNAAVLRQAHQLIESHRTIGKIVIENSQE